MKTRSKAELLLLTCTIIWGGTFVIVKGGLEDAPPVMFVAIRFVVATILFYPFVAKGLMSMSGASFKGGIVIGTLLFVGFLTQTIGLQYTTASKSGFITGLLVVFTPIFQIVIERKPPKIGNVLGVVLVTGGLYLLTSPEGSEFNVGDWLTLLCAAVFGLYIVFLDVYAKVANVWHMNFMQFALTAVASSLIALVFEDFSVNLTPGFLGAVAYLALFATLYTITIQARFQKETTPTRAAIIFAVEPVFAAGFAYLFLGEEIGGWGVVGGSLVVVGLLVSELSDILFRRSKIPQPDSGD